MPAYRLSPSLHAGYAFLAFLVGASVWGLIQPDKPAHEIKSVKVEVIDNQNLILRTVAVRRENCDSVITRHFTSLETGRVITMIDPGGKLPANGVQTEVPFYAKLPEPLTTGKYSYNAVALNKCSDGVHVAPSPLAYFTVK
jgi:hypothetical protein